MKQDMRHILIGVMTDNCLTLILGGFGRPVALLLLLISLKESREEVPPAHVGLSEVGPAGRPLGSKNFFSSCQLSFSAS